MKFFLSFFIASFLIKSLAAQETPLPADEIMQQAYSQASKENKKVLVMFHASWCGWCHKMDSSLNDRTVKGYFDKSFVTTHLTIQETSNKRMQENPGALEMYNKYGGGDNQGIPFWLIFDKNGKLLADSRLKSGSNSGCPATKEEVDYFIDVLKRTTKITPQEIAAVEKRFRRNDQ